MAHLITRTSTRRLARFRWEATYVIEHGIWQVEYGYTRRHALRRLRREMAR
jgi:hypothetical protein